MIVTEEMVVATWNHLEHHYGSRRLNKADSQDMELVARFLHQMGIVDHLKFMEKYTTTIEEVIYVPFEVGNARSMPLDRQLQICLHEHQHVHQWREGRGLFILQYVSDPDLRAAFEAEAMQVNLELDYWLNRSNRHHEAWVNKLKDYALKDEHLATVVKRLDMAYRTISKGGISTDVGRFIIPWLIENYGGHHI